MSIRDPVERLKSAHNFRKLECHIHKGQACLEECVMFDSCYTTLNALCEGVCDGSFCGAGWGQDGNWTSEYIRPGLKNKILQSCDDVRLMVPYEIEPKEEYRTGT